MNTNNLFEHRWLLTLAVLLFGGFAVFFLAIGKPGPEPIAIVESAPPLVRVKAIVPAQKQFIVASQGTIKPRREIDLIAEVSGKVSDVAESFVSGGFFNRGDKLLQLDDRNYRFALVRAQSQLATAEEQLATERGRVRQAKREWRELGNPDANSLFLREPQLRSAQASVEAAEADRDQALKDQKNTVIYAPFNGRVRDTLVELGQYVILGNPLAQFYDTDRVEVEFALSDSQVALLDLPLAYREARSNAPIEVDLYGQFGGKVWQWPALIKRTGASIDIDSRMFYVVAEVSDPFKAHRSGRPPLNIGQYVEARIKGKSFADVITLPRSALHKKNNVWLVDKQQRLMRFEVEVLQSDTETAAVRGNFPADHYIVLSPLAMAHKGMLVEIQIADME